MQFSDKTCCGLRCYGLLRDVSSFVTGISGQPIGPMFRGQNVFLGVLSPEDRSNTLSRNVANKLPIDAAQRHTVTKA